MNVVNAVNAPDAIITTERLYLRELTDADADNEPSRKTMGKAGLSFWKEYVDKGVAKVAYRIGLSRQ